MGRLSWLLMASVALVQSATAGAQTANERPSLPANLTAHYSIEWLGLVVGEVAWSLSSTADAYGFAMTARSAGTARTFVDVTSQVEATGLLCAASACARQYQSRTKVRNGEYRRHVRYDSDGKANLVEFVVPEDGWGRERAPVPQEQQIGPDPVGAMLALMARAQPGRTATGRSFDGKQVVHYRLSCPAALSAVPASSNAVPHEGAGYACSLKADVVAGRALSEEAEESYRDRPAVTIWMAAMPTAGQLIPLQFAYKSRLGTARGTLTRLETGGRPVWPSLNRQAPAAAKRAGVSR